MYISRKSYKKERKNETTQIPLPPKKIVYINK